MNPVNNTAIPIKDINSVPQVFTPTSTVNPFDYTSPINQVQTDIFGGVQNAQNQVNQLTEQAKQKSSSIATLESLLGNKAQDTTNLYDTTGVTNLYNQLSDLNAQATGLKNEAAAIPIQVQQQALGQGVTDRGIAPIETAKLRDNALKALSLGQQYAIVSGNYDKARNYADQLITAKYSQIEANINARKTDLAALEKYDLTPAQTKLLNAQNAAIKKQEQELADKKANEKAISDMIVNASSQGAPSTLLERAKLAKTPTEVATILGQYAGDYYKIELLKSQIANQKAETAKKYAELKALDLKNSPLSLVGNNVVAPNGDAVGLPVNYLSAIAKTKLNEGQSNAVAFVSRMIQADKALQNQIGVVNPEGGFYETSGYDPTSVGSGIGRLVGSDNSRVYNTNAQDFIRAKLRKESGATISPEEMAADTPIYTPSGYGLDEKDLLLAQTKRDEAIKSMIAQAGPAAPILLQYYTESKQTNTTSNNPFSAALGGGTQPIAGSSIVSGVGSSGDINFKLP